MGKILLNSAVVLVAGKDLSNYAFSLDTPDERDQVDVSGFNPTAASEFLPGKRVQSAAIGFVNDYAGTAGPHQTLQPLYESGTSFAISIQPDPNAAQYLKGTVSMFSYNGISGQLGARAELTATFSPAPNATLAWGTTP